MIIPRPSRPLYLLLQLLAVICLLLPLAACDMLGQLPASTGDQPDQPVQDDAPEEQVALLTFRVQIPPDTPPDQPILLSVLDEVTGLALNAQRHTMTRLDDTHYEATLPFKLGTVVKYRYSRQADVIAEEHTSSGRAVRYRLFHVENPGEVIDTVTRWNDTLYQGASGRVTGVVVNEDTGQPLPGILVASGGAQTFTAGDGSYLLEGLPPGTHNLVTYALDGMFQTFQQGALVAEGANTVADLRLKPVELVAVSFLVHVPENTVPAVPLRLAGNLVQLGNTFADLSGGLSTLPSRMPTLSSLPENTYGIILNLPAGADIRYKYSLGDGFWNAERSSEGAFRIRQFIVPDADVTIEDTVDTWQIGDKAEITFDVTVSPDTPPEDTVSIQFSPYGWTEPLPMWPLGDGRWAYILFSPLDLLDQFGYRFCRAGQCGHADDARTPGEFTSGQIIETSFERLWLQDQVERWAWLESELPDVYVTDTKVPKRGQEFTAGIQLQHTYHPAWDPLFPGALEKVSDTGANWIILNPSWSYTRLSPPVLEIAPGQDMLWQDQVNLIQQAQEQDLKIGIYPVPNFPTATAEWWAAAPRDFSWWVSWFHDYRAFILHYADLAESTGAGALILGGDWISPALPGGTLADGSLSGVPVDAEERYRDLIAEVRTRYNGALAWVLPYPHGLSAPPKFIDDVDQIQIVWSAPLAAGPDATAAQLQAAAEEIIRTDIYAFWLVWKPGIEDKSIIISLAYPSATGILTGCLADPIAECLPPASLDYPAPDYPLLELDMKSQARAYDAVLAAINTQDWIDGVISTGYYPPTVLHDKSTSIHAKPAEGVIRSWYTRFLRE